MSDDEEEDYRLKRARRLGYEDEEGREKRTDVHEELSAGAAATAELKTASATDKPSGALRYKKPLFEHPPPLLTAPSIPQTYHAMPATIRPTKKTPSQKWRARTTIADTFAKRRAACKQLLQGINDAPQQAQSGEAEAMEQFYAAMAQKQKAETIPTPPGTPPPPSIPADQRRPNLGPIPAPSLLGSSLLGTAPTATGGAGAPLLPPPGGPRPPQLFMGAPARQPLMDDPFAVRRARRQPPSPPPRHHDRFHHRRRGRARPISPSPPRERIRGRRGRRYERRDSTVSRSHTRSRSRSRERLRRPRRRERSRTRSRTRSRERERSPFGRKHRRSPSPDRHGRAPSPPRTAEKPLPADDEARSRRERLREELKAVEMAIAQRRKNQDNPDAGEGAQ